MFIILFVTGSNVQYFNKITEIVNNSGHAVAMLGLKDYLRFKMLSVAVMYASFYEEKMDEHFQGNKLVKLSDCPVF